MDWTKELQEDAEREEAANNRATREQMFHLALIEQLQELNAELRKLVEAKA